MISLKFEQELWQRYKPSGLDYALAFDEAGRGPLFGPVTLGAFLINSQSLNQLPQLAQLWQLTDSKKMPATKRRQVFAELQKTGWVKVKHIAVYYIEKYNINRAIEYGIYRLVKKICQEQQRPPLFLLIDGNYKFNLGLPTYCQVKGDSLCLTIAAASVAAKVSRDRLIEKVADRYSAYEIASHKGYGTPRHLAAIQRWGASRYHRKSFLKLTTC